MYWALRTLENKTCKNTAKPIDVLISFSRRVAIEGDVILGSNFFLYLRRRDSFRNLTCPATTISGLQRKGPLAKHLLTRRKRRSFIFLWTWAKFYFSLCFTIKTYVALGHFPTRMMEDESLLKQGVSATTELAIQFRIQKKSIIIDVMRDLTKRVKSLRAKDMTTTQT